MDILARIKKHEARIEALEAGERPKTDTVETGLQLGELRFGLDAALERLSAVEARLDVIAAQVEANTEDEG